MAGGLNILILEDEGLAVERLLQLIEQVEPNANIVATLDTISETVDYFKNNPAPDLCFFDIQVADGLSFQVFEQVEIETPIIFTTAFDEYALKAFKVNSIDYLLKPIKPEQLASALEKFHALRRKDPAPLDWRMLQQTMQQLNQTDQFKSRFIVKSRNKLIPIQTSDIACFFSEHKTAWLINKEGKKFGIDNTLEKLETTLDPKHFFRVNRKYIIAIDSIQSVGTYSNSRLKIDIPGAEEEIIISRERVSDFKTWLDS